MSAMSARGTRQCWNLRANAWKQTFELGRGNRYKLFHKFQLQIHDLVQSPKPKIGSFSKGKINKYAWEFGDGYERRYGIGESEFFMCTQTHIYYS